MQITNVRIKLPDQARSHGQLLAFVELELDKSLVIHDMRIIKGTYGDFVAMPDRKIRTHCPDCGYKNELLARYCNYCGIELSDIREEVMEGDTCPECDGFVVIEFEGGDPKPCPICKGMGTVRARIHLDIVHPISEVFRTEMQTVVLKAYHEEVSSYRLKDWNAIKSMIV